MLASSVLLLKSNKAPGESGITNVMNFEPGQGKMW